MLIEIAGIPGCGKTTLYKRLGMELKRRGVAYADANTIAMQRSDTKNAPRFVRNKPNRDLLFQLVCFTMQNPDFFAKVQLSFGNVASAKFWFFLLCTNFQMAQNFKKKDEIVFLDEGFLTHGVAIHPTKSQRSNLVGLLECAPKIDVLIFVDTPAKTAFERAVERAGGTAKKREGVMQKFGDVDAFVERSSLFKAGLEVYKDRCSRIFVVEATENMDDAIKQLVDDLVQLNAAK